MRPARRSSQDSTGFKVRRRFLGPAALALVFALMATALPAAPTAQAATSYNGLGFDTCGAPSSQAMAAWTQSPFRSVGIYIGGANRACPDGNLSPGWISVVESQGWRLVPIYVGLQAPCAAQAGLARIDENQPATQGTQGADDAVARAQHLGLVPSSPVYFDMEGYNNTSSNQDPGCVPSVLQYLGAWSTEVHRLGYLAGVYGSASSTISDQVAAVPNTPRAALFDDIWIAEWNGQATVASNYVPGGYWSQHQRLHQFSGGHDETWNGITMNIDSDYTDGALACVGGGASNVAVPALLNGPPSWGGPSNVGPTSGGGQVAGKVYAVSAGPTRVDAFWRGVDANLWTASYADGCGWGAPLSLGNGPLGSDPHPVSSASGRIDVFWRGTDNGLWHSWNNGPGWAGPGSLGGSGTMSSDPYPVTPNPTAITVLWRRADANLGSASYSDSTGWQGPGVIGGGPLGSAPHPVVYGPGMVAAFWRGTDSNLWQMTTAGNGWSGPRFLGSGPLGGEPQPASAGAGRIDVFWRGTDNGLWHSWFWANSGWNGPGGLGGSGGLAGDPTALSAAGGRLAVLARGLDGNLHSLNFSDAKGWNKPVSVGGGPLSSDPIGVGTAPGRLEVYWRDTGALAQHMWAYGI